MALPTPPVIVTPFSINGDKVVLPVAASATPGRASYDLGFPPQTRLPTTAGGIPPFGTDFNGLFYDLSANVACLAAGIWPVFSQTFSDFHGGYPAGVVLRSASTAGLYWSNQVDSNTNDPDTVSTGWVSWRAPAAGFLAAPAPAGTSNNFEPAGWNTSVGVFDINPSSGNAALSGLKAGYDGQRVLVSNVGATYLLTLLRLNGSSDAANRFRAATDFSLVPGGACWLQYSTGAGLWIVIP